MSRFEQQEAIFAALGNKNFISNKIEFTEQTRLSFWKDVTAPQTV